jgi:hypothetical protein
VNNSWLIRLTVDPAALIAREMPEGCSRHGGISACQSIDCLVAGSSSPTIEVVDDDFRSIFIGI